MLKTVASHEAFDTHHVRVTGQSRPWAGAAVPSCRVVPVRSSAAPRIEVIKARWIEALPALLAFYVVLNMADLVTTNLGLIHGLREGNPLMSGLLISHGFVSLVVYKAAIVVGVVGGVLLLGRRHRNLAATTITICNALVGLAVLANIVQMVWLH